jgi:large subunit ribosomal protein L21
MYAIIKTGGKQYKVALGSLISVEKLEGDPETQVELTDVLAVSGEDGNLKIGSPTLEGAKVVARIVAQGKGPKIKGITFKPKKNQRRRYGHRQSLTHLCIESISA